MKFYYLHQIKHETCMHEEGMNITRPLATYLLPADDGVIIKLGRPAIF